MSFDSGLTSGANNYAGDKNYKHANKSLAPSLDWTSGAVNDPLRITLHDAVQWLESRDVSYALIGGLAASLRGQTRATADVDLVIATTVEGALEMVAQLENGPFAPLFSGVDEVIQRAFILPLRHRTSGVKVDMAIGLSGFEQMVISRATAEWLADRLIRVASAEDLIVMKTLAGRPQDEQDLAGIMTAQMGQLDWSYCLRVADELGEAIGQDLGQRIRSLRDKSLKE